MVILVIALFLVGVVLALFALLGSSAATSADKVAGGKRQQEESKEQKILKLEGQIDSLRLESERLKSHYADLEKQLETAKHNELKLKEELSRREEWVKKSEEDLNKEKARYSEFEKQFINKDKELQAEFTKNVNLNRELKEAKDRVKLLEGGNKEKSDQIESLKHQIEGYIKEVKRYADALSELKKKEDTSEWVPKTEFHKLNEEYTELEKELEEKDGRIKKLTEEIIRLNNRLKEAGKAVEGPAQEKEQPQQEEVIKEEPLEETKEKDKDIE